MSEPKSPTGVAASGSGAEASTAGAAGVKSGTAAAARPSAGLRLLAFDAADLTVVAAHLQDAVCRVRDMAFVPKDERFVLLLNRFDWLKSPPDTDQSAADQGNRLLERRRCALRLEHVRTAKVTGFVQSDKRRVLSLLTISFEQAREGDPDGTLTLLFAGGPAIRLEVECIEGELVDIGMGWRTTVKPEHPEF